jgi:hypothetical protein
MNISIQQNIIFTSRNATIRRAEDIARRANNAFPMQSNSKFKVMGGGWAKTLYAYKELSEKIFLMREYVDKKTSEAPSLIDKFKIFASSIRKNKVGNCGESTRLTLLAAKMNGIRGVYEAILVSGKKALDHEVVFVNAEKPYIIDPWLGFADYEQNTICRWKNEYKNYFNFEDEDWKNLRVVRYKDLGCPSEYDRELYPEEMGTLRGMYPELILKI